jgi:PAS domain S-box-containing protein
MYMDLNKLLKLSADLICTVDINGRFLAVSDASFLILGYTPEEMTGKYYHNFVYPPDLLLANQSVNTVLTQRRDTQIQIRYVHKYGHVVPLLWCVQWDEETQLMYGIARSGHITEQTELMRLSLEESNKRYEFVTQATSDAIWDWDIAMGTLYLGEGFEKIFGHNIEELPAGLICWQQFIHPDDAKYILTSLANICASSDTNWKEEYRYQKADGTFADVVDRGFVIRDKDNIAIRMVGAMHDISERKRGLQEMKQVTADLFKRNRELHEFGYIVSHNLRSPVANIKGVVTLLQLETDVQEHIKPYLTNLINSVSRLDEVIIDLSKILSSKNTSADLILEPMDLQEIIHTVKTDLAGTSLKDSVQIAITGGPFSIISHKAYIYSIFHNLIANSIKFKGPKRPFVSIAVVQSEQVVNITYADNSSGIDLLKHGSEIFRPYKQFHSTIKGKGLGLFLVKSYVEALHGSVTVISEMDRGVSYTVTLPKS